MAKHTRKGKNPGPVDAWLDTLGYYRKNVAYDETCLFRAISEQMFSCQIYHERCRKEVVAYGRKNYFQFQHLVNCEEEWAHRMDKLEIHMVICGNIELEIASRSYKRDIIVFDSINRCVRNISKLNCDETLLLCLMAEDHYDVVYKREYIQTAGFCQSIIYNTLYENVFKIPNVINIVQAMLYDKPNLTMNENKQSTKQEKQDPQVNDLEYMLRTNIAPFPYKVAKALDPTIYRNIEYDTWTETRKELRLGDWYYGDNNLILGTCCLLSTSTGVLQCYIQEILKGQNKCVVYITSLAEKRTVNYSDLAAEADAKPWPLPYRFAKSVMVPTPKLEMPDKEKKIVRKRRDNKRSASKCSSDSGNSLSAGISCDQNESCNVNVYEGCPLQMQHAEDYENRSTTQLSDANTQVNYSDMGYSAEPSWEQPPSTTNEQSTIWPHTSNNPQSILTLVPKPVIPGTPELPYTTDPFYYNNVPRYPGWTNTPTDYVQTVDQLTPETSQMDIPTSPEPYSYTYYDNIFSPPVPLVASDRSVCTTPLTPTSPQIEMYPSYYAPPPPVTPVIYAPPEITEILIPSPHVPVYSPAIEMSYISPTPFIYPPTPPATWYPPAINSQGFIFPAPVTTQNVPSRM